MKQRKQLKGLRSTGEDIIFCDGCRSRLLSIQKYTIDHNKSDCMTRMVVHCGICGGESSKIIMGRYFAGTCSDSLIITASDVVSIDDFHVKATLTVEERP